MFLTLNPSESSGVLNSLNVLLRLPFTFHRTFSPRSRESGISNPADGLPESCSPVSDTLVRSYTVTDTSELIDPTRNRDNMQRKGAGNRGGQKYPNSMVEPPPTPSIVNAHHTQWGHIVLTIGFALLISTTLIRSGVHARILQDADVGVEVNCQVFILVIHKSLMKKANLYTEISIDVLGIPPKNSKVPSHQH